MIQDLKGGSPVPAQTSIDQEGLSKGCLAVQSTAKSNFTKSIGMPASLKDAICDGSDEEVPGTSTTSYGLFAAEE